MLQSRDPDVSVERKKKKRKGEAASSAERIHPASVPALASKEAARLSKIPPWYEAEAARGEEVSVGVDLSNVGDGRQVLLFRLPADVTPQTLHGVSVKLPTSTTRSAAAGGMEVQLDPAATADRLLLLSNAHGRTCAAKVSAVYTLSHKMRDADPEEEPIDPALLAMLRDGGAASHAAAPAAAKDEQPPPSGKKKKRKAEAAVLAATQGETQADDAPEATTEKKTKKKKQRSSTAEIG